MVLGWISRTAIPSAALMPDPLPTSRVPQGLQRIPKHWQLGQVTGTQGPSIPPLPASHRLLPSPPYGDKMAW